MILKQKKYVIEQEVAVLKCYTKLDRHSDQGLISLHEFSILRFI